MTFEPEHNPQPYIPSPTPSLEGADKLYLQRELRSLQTAIGQIVKAVVELQENIGTTVTPPVDNPISGEFVLGTDGALTFDFFDASSEVTSAVINAQGELSFELADGSIVSEDFTVNADGTIDLTTT